MTDPSPFFSQSYAEAREKFLAAVSEAGAETESYENPHRGSNGEHLYTDVALLGPDDASSIVVLCSGTHGVEGYCGSAIQTGLLRDRIAEQLSTDMGVVMIHALNPYGFSHFRRVNEDNVDLNRNFVDHGEPHPDNPAYDALFDLINPRVDLAWRREAAFLRLLLARVTEGEKRLKVAITGGQYNHPLGLFYGGRSAAWSNETLQAIAERHLERAKRVAFIDIHTGLGPFAHGELICRHPAGSAIHGRMTDWWGDRVKAAEQSEAAAAELSGTTTHAIAETLPETEVTAVTLEFGTFGTIKMLRTLQAENWCHQNGDADDARFRASKEALKHAFYPRSEKWKATVWEQARSVVSGTIEALY